MEKEKRLNPEIIQQLVLLYQGISEANSLDLEISEMVKNNHPQESELVNEKYETFFSKYQVVGEQLNNHLALVKNFSTIFEVEINALAIEKSVGTKKSGVNHIDKQYSKLRIYYQAVDNRFSTSSHGYTYPNFGMLLICSLSFNDRIFKFEIARTEKGCDKYCSSQIRIQNLTITTKSQSFIFITSQELKFCSSEKFNEVLNICETITERVNIELEKAGLEKFLSNIELSEK